MSTRYRDEDGRRERREAMAVALVVGVILLLLLVGYFISACQAVG